MAIRRWFSLLGWTRYRFKKRSPRNQSFRWRARRSDHEVLYCTRVQKIQSNCVDIRPGHGHSDVDAVVARLVRLYTSAGLAYAKSIANYELLLPLLQRRVGMLAEYPERTAACLYMMGRKDEARSFTEKFFAQHRDYFEGFAAPFRELLDRESADEVTRLRIRARSARVRCQQRSS